MIRRADIEKELEVVTRSRNRYRWLAGASAGFGGLATGGLFVELGLNFDASTFLTIAFLGLLSCGLAVVSLLRKQARWSKLRTELLSIEVVSAQSIESDG